MNRSDLLLLVLAAAKGQQLSPAQLQKAVFLIDKNCPELIQDAEHFNFEPYNYGPFDRDVYVEAEKLRDRGLAIIAPSENGRWNTYAVSPAGQNKAKLKFFGMKSEPKNYIRSVVDWVLAQSFGSLVKAIYDQYPEMKANSIFQG